MTLTPHTPRAAALMAAFYAEGHERFRPFLSPDPSAAPRFMLEPPNVATSITLPSFVGELRRAVNVSDHRDAEHAAALTRWEAKGAELDARVEAARHDTRERPPTPSEFTEHAKSRPTRREGLSPFPPGFRRLDRFDRDELAALVLDLRPESVTLDHLRRLDSADLSAVMAPGCPNVIDGETCGEPLPGKVINRRFGPSWGTRDWNTAAPWPAFGFCSNACRTSYGAERRKAFDALREFVVRHSADVWADLATAEAEVRGLRFRLDSAEEAVRVLRDTLPTPTAEEAAAT